MKKLQLITAACLTLASGFQLYSQPDDAVAFPAADNKPDVVKVYVKQDPAKYQRKSMQGGEITFSVQVSATTSPVSENTVIQEWKELGNVYIQKENGMFKVRIGPYETQQEAKQVLLGVKSKGRKDAFIVVQQSGNNDAPITKAAPALNQSPKIINSQPTVVEGDYKVRVASYLHPGSFNPDGIDQLGKLESYRKGDLTIMMIGGFRSVDEAMKAKKVVISKGFTDAAIVMDNNGILETVKEN